MIFALAFISLLLAGCDKKTETTGSGSPATAPVVAGVASPASQPAAPNPAHVGARPVVRARILMDPMTRAPFYKKFADRLPFVEDVRVQLTQAGCEITDDDQKPFGCDRLPSQSQVKFSSRFA